MGWPPVYSGFWLTEPGGVCCLCPREAGFALLWFRLNSTTSLETGSVTASHTTGLLFLVPSRGPKLSRGWGDVVTSTLERQPVQMPSSGDLAYFLLFSLLSLCDVACLDPLVCVYPLVSFEGLGACGLGPGPHLALFRSVPLRPFLFTFHISRHRTSQSHSLVRTVRCPLSHPTLRSPHSTLHEMRTRTA